MDHRIRIDRLARLLKQISEGNIENVTPVIEPGAEGVPIGPHLQPDEASKANEGLEKLKLGRHDLVTSDEADGLEAIIMLRERPVFFLDKDSYPTMSNPWTTLNADGTRKRLTEAIRSIGRIELPTQPMYPFGGTGFLVGDGLLMTNRHVAQLFSHGLGVDGLLFTPGDAAVDFRRERTSPPDDRSTWFEIERVIMVHPYWDMALLKVKGLQGYEPLKLRVDEPAVGQNIVVVGYPARDDRNDLAEQDRIFERLYNVKRFMPGRIRPRVRIKSFEQIVNATTHDASTLGGCSGSAVLDSTSGEVVALHFAGEYLITNYGVPAMELARDARVRDAGVKFSGTLPPPTNEWDDAWRRVGAMEGAKSPSPARSASTQAAPAASAAFAESVTWDVPLRVTVSIGSPTRVEAIATSAAPAIAPVWPQAEGLRIPIIFDGLEDRAGYDPAFLGIDVALPSLSRRGAQIAAPLIDGGGHELKYEKFSIVMHKRRRLALFTASNVDWREIVRLVDGKRPSRRQLTGLREGEIEKWMSDRRLLQEHQLPDIFWTQDGGAFDKGHLIRRDDVAYGANLIEMQRGNGDTYHTTNCSPQIAGFNQSARGVDNWGDLENLVQQQTRSEKAAILSGPVLADDDPLFEGRGDNGTSIVLRIPRRFWKIIIVLSEKGQPQAYGFMLEQDLSAVPTREEFAVNPAWRRHMCSLQEIEAQLFGLASFGSVNAWDQFGSAGGESVERAM